MGKRPSPSRAGPIDLASLVHAYLGSKARSLGPLSGGTIRAYRTDLCRFLAAMADSSPQDITPLVVERFIGALSTRPSRPFAPASINRTLASLRGFFAWAVATGAIDRNPTAGIPANRLPDPEAKALGPELRQRLLQRARRTGPREAALVELALGTGLRAAELLSLNLGDLDLRDRAINLRRGKGGRGRVVYLAAKTARAIEEYLGLRGPAGPGDPLFVTARGRLSYAQADRLLKMAAGELRNPDGSRLRLHQLRHDFATEQLARGMAPFHLARLTGHRDLRMLDRYTTASRDAAARAEFRAKNR